MTPHNPTHRHHVDNCGKLAMPSSKIPTRGFNVVFIFITLMSYKKELSASLAALIHLNRNNSCSYST